MSIVFTVLPSQITNCQIVQATATQQYLEYTVEVKNEKLFLQAFEWDLNSQTITNTALANLLAVNYKDKTIKLEYQKKMLLSEAYKTQKLDKLKILFQLIEACYELHKKSLLGRCFSISTIEIDYDSQIKIYRYGFIHDLQIDKEIITLPPEYLIDNQLSLSSDIWMIGMIFYQLVFGKSLVNYVYPKDLQSYTLYIKNQMKTNTFENLFDNQIDSRFSILLQLLLIFDEENRLQSYPAALYFLKENLDPKYSKKITEMASFYDQENQELQMAITLIETRSKQRDMKNYGEKKHKQRRSISQQKQLKQNNQIYYQQYSKTKKLVNRLYSYEYPMEQFNLIYKIELQEFQKNNNAEKEFCVSFNFNLYSINFLINLRNQLRMYQLTQKEAVLIEHYLYTKTFQRIKEIKKLATQSQKNYITFQIDLNKICQKLKLLKKNMKELNKMCHKVSGIYNNNSCIDEILKQLEKVETRRNLLELKLRLQIALKIETIFKDCKEVNKSLFPIIYYLGIYEITDPIEVERFLQRGRVKNLEQLFNYSFNTLKNESIMSSVSLY